MSTKEIANADMTIEVVAPAQGQVSVISQPSMDVKIGGSGVYSGPLQFSVSNITSPGMGLAVPGTFPSGAIQPTAADTMAENKPVLRVGDKIDGLVSADAMNPGPNGNVPSPITFSVEIKDAGQTDVKAS